LWRQPTAIYSKKSQRADFAKTSIIVSMWFRLSRYHFASAATISPGLAQGFFNDLTLQGLPRRTLSPGALEALQDFAWPGNVRQLKNFLEQAVIASDDELLTLPFVQSLLAQAGGCERACAAAQVAPGIDTPLPDQLAEDNAHWPMLAKLERDHLVYTLEHTYYNQSAAARLVGISRQALIRLIKK
jgi:DNA-binding NtrC family response regulator